MKKKNEFKVGQVYKYNGKFLRIIDLSEYSIYYSIRGQADRVTCMERSSAVARRMVLVNEEEAKREEEKERVSLLELAKPVAQYLKDNYPPHAKIVIGFEGIEVLKQERFFINPLR